MRTAPPIPFYYFALRLLYQPWYSPFFPTFLFTPFYLFKTHNLPPHSLNILLLLLLLLLLLFSSSSSLLSFSFFLSSSSFIALSYIFIQALSYYHLEVKINLKKKF
ncbi:hypothetical protein HMI54_015442 [Coelomomyces lativittatus]|nr:hypothetical protein HMI54_015442 [Coelomomyces lativittatus]